MKTSWILLLASTSVMTSCVANRNVLAPIAYQQEVEEAGKLIDRGNALQAIDDLTVLIQINPKDTQAIFVRGVAYQSLERFEKSIEDFQAVVKLNPRHAKSYYNLGMIYAYKLNEPKLALENFDHYLDENLQEKNAFQVAKIMMSLDSPGRVFLAPGARVQQILDEAQKTENIKDRRIVLEKAMKEDPTSPIFPYLLGQSYDNKDRAPGNDAKTAQRYYEKTLAVRPTCSLCQKSLGDLLIRQGKIQDGQACLKKATLFDPASYTRQARN